MYLLKRPVADFPDSGQKCVEYSVKYLHERKILVGPARADESEFGETCC